MNKGVIICPRCGLVICPKCGWEMILKTGEHGKFYGCLQYPTCKYSLDKELVELERDKINREWSYWEEDEENSELEDYDENGGHVDDKPIYSGQKQ